MKSLDLLLWLTLGPVVLAALTVTACFGWELWNLGRNDRRPPGMVPGENPRTHLTEGGMKHRAGLRRYGPGEWYGQTWDTEPLPEAPETEAAIRGLHAWLAAHGTERPAGRDEEPNLYDCRKL